MPAQPQHLFRWPEGAIVYHIYPRSFQDSNGDGVGDIPGITSRLDYLKSLSVTAIWLSPFYPSPMADFGYDVADYLAVDPIFGTMEDFDSLLEQAHARDMKVIIDLVPNHTSDEHEWFKQSRKSKDNPYSDWYIWRSPLGFEQDGSPIPPNNWLDEFSGESVWEWDETRWQFYLHSYHKKQPDLNWSNPAVREAFKDGMRFWLDKGVDGFRVDAVYWMGKDPLLTNDPPNPHYIPGSDDRNKAIIPHNSRGWPFIYAYLTEMADMLKEEKYQDSLRFMVTEAYPETHNPLESYLAFYIGVDPSVAAPFNFEGVTLAWQAGAWNHFLRSFHVALEQFSPLCIPSYAFGNHDNSRLINRLGSDAAARSAAVMLLTLPGMVFIYNGEEIGMHNVDIPPEMVQDPQAKRDPHNPAGRDIARTPLQWTPGKHAGFTDGSSTWLPIAPDYKERNVEVESKDPHSFLSLYRKLGEMRTRNLALRTGSLKTIKTHSPDVVGYFRFNTDEAYLVLINFANKQSTCRLLEKSRTLRFSTVPGKSRAVEIGEEVDLAPHEAVLFEVDPEDCTLWP
ncbi:MAG TPA: alpha-amylase family glycosyl hydrolase [Candidatus Limnocylindrales bacterium]|nr:alpha-amylase family glycosyl hydrolase [Candidatus Limnocylindrales bacterium]